MSTPGLTALCPSLERGAQRTSGLLTVETLVVVSSLPKVFVQKLQDRGYKYSPFVVHEAQCR